MYLKLGAIGKALSEETLETLRPAAGLLGLVRRAPEYPRLRQTPPGMAPLRLRALGLCFRRGKV